MCKLKMVRDIVLLFAACVLLLLVVSPEGVMDLIVPGKNSNENPNSRAQGRKVIDVIDFSGDGAISGEKTAAGTLDNRGNLPGSGGNQTIEKSFTWIDTKQEQKETILHIHDEELKKEIKKFGVPHNMSHPFFLKKRGFTVVGKSNYLENHTVSERLVSIVDYRQVFERNLQYFPKYTGAILTTAELPTGTDPLYTLLLFVQHIRYELPPVYYKGKFINSFFVPLVCLFEQYGDCDSKSLLLAEILCTVPSAQEKTAMVLIRGRGLSHALLAVKRKPLPVQTSLFDIKKGYYVVLETTRPGWTPGFVNARVADALKAGFFAFVELN